jgi:hypothetical protein
VTYPPSDDPSPATPGWGPEQAPAAPWAAPVEAPEPRRSRRRLAIGAAVAGVVVLGGAGFAVAAYLSGGGTQPEDVLPADAIAFVKLDLDPSAGQKLALSSLLDKFPEIDIEGDSDVRADLVNSLLEESGTDLDYASDVQPWLGDRIGIAAVPSEGSDGGVAPVVALAVTDEGRMRAALTELQAGTGMGFAVRDDYVLVTDTQEHAEDFAATEDVLADDGDFAGDREALGGDQIALLWADLSEVQQLVQASVPDPSVGGMFGNQDLTGRVILGVHAQDDALELVGQAFSVSDFGVPDGEPTRLVQDLPEDTFAAVSVSELGDRAVAVWDEREASGQLAEVEQPLEELGLQLPDDLRTVLGTDLVVAAFGDLEGPTFGARVVTDDPEGAAGILDVLLSSADTGFAPVYSFGDRDYVVAVDGPTADALAADGGLGETEAFRAAVADPDEASAVGYVDLGRVIDQLIANGDQDAAKFAAVEALGFSASTTDEGGRIVLRITTR